MMNTYKIGETEIEDDGPVVLELPFHSITHMRNYIQSVMLGVPQGSIVREKDSLDKTPSGRTFRIDDAEDVPKLEVVVTTEESFLA